MFTGSVVNCRNCVMVVRRARFGIRHWSKLGVGAVMSRLSLVAWDVLLWLWFESCLRDVVCVCIVPSIVTVSGFAAVGACDECASFIFLHIEQLVHVISGPLLYRLILHLCSG